MDNFGDICNQLICSSIRSNEVAATKRKKKILKNTFPEKNAQCILFVQNPVILFLFLLIDAAEEQRSILELL